MRAALGGDASAYGHLLNSITPYIRTIVRAHCRRFRLSDTEAEDIVQEVLLTVHLKRGTWDQDREISPWIGAIIRNKAIDAFRRRGRWVTIPVEDVADVLASQANEPSIASQIDGLLRSLPSRQQEIVRSIAINGASARETAVRLNMTESAVRVALHRALKALGALYRRGETQGPTDSVRHPARC